METPTVSKRLDSFIFLYDLHTKLFKNVIDGISDKDAMNRLNTKANHIAWITGSVLHERSELAKALGKEVKQTTGELFRDHQGIQDNASYPSLEEYRKEWERISPVLRDALINATNEQLNKPFEMPGEKMTYFELIAFIIHREAYCIGQVGLYRRLLGYEPMKY